MFIKIYFYYFNVCVYICGCMGRPEVSDPPGTRVKVACEPQDEGLGTELRSSAGSIRTRCWATFPALTYFQPQQLVRTPKCCLYHKEAPQSEQCKLQKFISLQILEVTMKVSAGLPSSEDLYLWLMVPSSFCVFLRSLPAVCYLLASSYKDVSHIGLDPFYWSYFILITSLNCHKYSHT